MEIETENSLKLFRILFHFASFEFIALLRFLWSTQKKTNRNLYSCKRKKVLKVHCSWQNGENVNFPLIQKMSLFAPQWHINAISHSKFNKNKLENRFLNDSRFDFHLSTFSGVKGNLPVIPHHTSRPRVGVWAFIIEAV